MMFGHIRLEFYMVVIRRPGAALAALLLSAGLTALRAYQSELGTPRIQIIPRSPAEPGPDENAPPETRLRMDLSLVLIPVQVTTQDGAPITDLDRPDFHIYEEGAEQDIRYFAKDDAPVSVGLLFDSSASMKTKKEKASEAAAAFFRTATGRDEFFLIEFDEAPRLTVPFTENTADIYDEIRHTRPFGRTALYDAIHMALGTMKKAKHERKALVIVSDGGDNRSRRDFGAIRSAMVESDVQLYAMGIFDPQSTEDIPAEESRGPEVLEQLADVSGGRHFAVSLNNLTDVSARVGNLLRNRYLVGYSSSNPLRDGKYRRVAVDVTAPAGTSFRLQYRKGYFAPLH
jgi:Ca-activated chloride channel homolog